MNKRITEKSDSISGEAGHRIPPDRPSPPDWLQRVLGFLRQLASACVGVARRPFRSIRGRMIVAFVLLVLVTAGAVSLGSIIAGVENGKRQAFFQLESIAALKEAEIKAWLRNLQIDLLGFEEEDTFRDVALFLSETLPPSAQGRLRSKLRDRFQQIITLTKRFDELYLMSRDGMVVLSTNQAKEREFRGLQPYFRKGLIEPGVHVQTVSFSSSSEGLNDVVAVHPVQSRSGETLGVLCGVASLAALNVIMAERTGFGESGETYLVAANHVLMSVSRFPGFAPGLSYIDHDGANGALRNRTSGQGIYTNYRHASVAGVYRWLAELDVALLAEREEAETLRPIYRTVAFNAGVGAVAVVLAVLASVFLARGIARPMADLAETATRIAQGDLKLSAGVERRDEVGSLARAFNSMTFQLSRRIEMEKLVSDLSRKFIGLTYAEIDPAVEHALADACGFVGADQCNLFIFSEDGIAMDITHAWRHESIEPRAHGLQAAPLLWFPWLVSRLRKNNFLEVVDVSSLSSEALEEKRVWQSGGILSLICISLSYSGGLRGFIEFDSLREPKSWSGEDVRFLFMVGEIIRSTFERRRAAEELLASEEKNRSIIENALEGIYRSTPQGRFLSVNPAMARMLGYDSPQSLMESLTDIRTQLYVNPDDRDMFLRSIFEQGSVVVHELLFNRKDGGKMWASINARLVRNKAGDPLFIEGFMRDVTQRKQSQEEIRRLNEELEQRVIERTAELQAANRELEAFSYSVSHDLRTPLRSIDGFSQALLEDYSGQVDETGQDYLMRVRTASQHMGNLIDDLLRLSRVTRAEMTREEVDLGAMVREVIEELQRREPNREVEVIIADSPPVTGDPRLLRIMIENMVGNAWKFTARRIDARIELGLVQTHAASCAEDSVVRIQEDDSAGDITTNNNGGLSEGSINSGSTTPLFFLRDNGAGFDMAYANKLFKAFNRLHPLEEFEGTGIGLAIVERVIKRHGGTIRAEGEVGKGCVFYFSF